jgi:hypothetical protein
VTSSDAGDQQEIAASRAEERGAQMSWPSLASAQWQGDARHGASVNSDRGQGAAGADAAGEPLVELDAVGQARGPAASLRP